MWETGLRIETVERLEYPKHYAKGTDELRITADIDKNRFARVVDLTPRAKAALDAVLATKTEPSGLIFGPYSYRRALRSAAKAAGVLSEQEVAGLDARDFRHAMATDLANNTRSLGGVAYLLGHKDESTTARRYLHPGRDAANKAMRDRRDGNRPLAKLDTEVDTKGEAAERDLSSA